MSSKKPEFAGKSKEEIQKELQEMFGDDAKVSVLTGEELSSKTEEQHTLMSEAMKSVNHNTVKALAVPFTEALKASDGASVMEIAIALASLCEFVSDSVDDVTGPEIAELVHILANFYSDTIKGKGE